MFLVLFEVFCEKVLEIHCGGPPDWMKPSPQPVSSTFTYVQYANNSPDVALPKLSLRALPFAKLATTFFLNLDAKLTAPSSSTLQGGPMG